MDEDELREELDNLLQKLNMLSADIAAKKKEYKETKERIGEVEEELFGEVQQD